MNDTSLIETNSAFGESLRQFTGSTLFFKIFDETIALVQETSSYLDGIGKIESAAAGGDVAVLYTAESVRMSNMLMQVSSWLLAHRSYHRGDVDEIKHLPLSQPSEALSAEQLERLPLRMAVLSHKTTNLYARILHLDMQIRAGRGDVVSDIHARIQKAMEMCRDLGDSLIVEVD